MINFVISAATIFTSCLNSHFSFLCCDHRYLSSTHLTSSCLSLMSNIIISCFILRKTSRLLFVRGYSTTISAASIRYPCERINKDLIKLPNECTKSYSLYCKLCQSEYFTRVDSEKVNELENSIFIFNGTTSILFNNLLIALDNYASKGYLWSQLAFSRS